MNTKLALLSVFVGANVFANADFVNFEANTPGTGSNGSLNPPTRGFFPPQPLGVRRHETQHRQGQDQVSQQPGVVPPLVVHQSGLLLPEAERVLHRPPPEADLPLRTRSRRAPLPPPTGRRLRQSR